MDWIERLFHVSPDGGSGLVEALTYIALAIFVFLAIARRFIGRLLNLKPIRAGWIELGRRLHRQVPTAQPNTSR